MIQNGRKARIKRPIKCTANVNMAIEPKLLEEFKKITGKGYQVKIKELMQMYIDAYYRKLDDRRR